jgi:UDP-N-acetylmuramoyl-L-alanyl-D-glutamate--2,6-diaminopimelate ligase
VTDANIITAAALAASVGAKLIGDGSVALAAITHDSRRVSVGSIFCCVVGRMLDGHDFAGAALDAGAAALLVDQALDLPITQLLVDDVRAAMGPAASEVYGRPSEQLSVLGVTGTNGKTTTVTIAAHLLESTGRPTAVIGTLTGARTTPEAPDLQRQLRDAVTDGKAAVAMEVSSHALALGRVDGVHFAAAAFTNLGLDHLDFHETPERYFEAKARLFEPERTAVAVLDVDDVHGRLLRDTLVVPVVPVSVDDLEDLRLDGAGAHFIWRGHAVHLPLLGRHNVADALLAAESCVAMGADPVDIAAALATVTPPPGRFEPVEVGQPFRVVVDFAHTPEALGEAIEAARAVAEGRVIVVFGAGGDRDPSKRTRMGEVADRLADVIVITSDNPRSEDPSTIMAAVRRGVERIEPRLVEDRHAAIGTALADAGPGDVVLIAGKGHEVTQIIGETELPFDDRLVAAEALVALGWGSGRGSGRA